MDRKTPFEFLKYTVDFPIFKAKLLKSISNRGSDKGGRRGGGGGEGRGYPYP